MILSNYWAWFKDIQTSSSSGTLSNTNIFLHDGTTQASLNYSASHCRSLYAGNTYFKVEFGSGTTPPEVNDYCLAADETSNLTIVQNVTPNWESNKFELLISCTITNTTANSITINEIGINKNFGSGNTWFLLAREVLDTPLTIPAGETRILNYTWTMQ